ncbi:cation diffusion facilitator family transporter [Puniceicoccaceae bacterium K14]|nr:cation diffusion facilitator family transporter [Puniceicoccaceae bacterium K14]
MNLSLGIGIGMLLLKSIAYFQTGSAAILSDAAESVVHVVAVAFATYSLYLSQKPADKEHRYGHTKISFVSAGFEGVMIILAAAFIIYESTAKWISGLEIQNLDTGLILTASALIINGGLGFYLILIGKRRNSLILKANGKHVLTDAWTSLGVVVGVALTWFTGWLPLDPICAYLVAINILVAGIGLVKESLEGLLDKADPELNEQILQILKAECTTEDIQFHGLRHLNTGEGHRVEFHLLFEDSMSIQDAHRVATRIENKIKQAHQTPIDVSTHLEPKRDHEQIHTDNHVQHYN